MNLLGKIGKIEKGFLATINGAREIGEVETIRVRFLGRKGELTAILKSLKNLSLADRRKFGPAVQRLRVKLDKIIADKITVFKNIVVAPKVDITAPGKKFTRGHLHPLTLVDREVRHIFRAMNFSVVDGPEIETEHYNFDALNIPADHPARDMWDTFWLKTQNYAKRTQTNAEKIPRKSAFVQRESALLRTHTSPVQVRYMEKNEPPFQIIVPGRVFRYEATDAAHEINFHQVEGLMVGKNVTLANFKFVVEEFFKRFFSAKGGSSSGGKNQKIEFRYRPSYFPFVEPGLEVDIKMGGQWLEIMGAGMVHPRVFEYARYNPDLSSGGWQGFAFGVGLDRLAMIKYKIPDIRLFYSGDLRFIKQF